MLLKEDSLASVRTIANARQVFMQMRTIVYAHIFAVDDDGKYIAEKNLDQKSMELAKILEGYQSLVSDDDDRRLLERNTANLKAYVDAMKEKPFPLSRANDMPGVRAVIFTDLGPLAAGTEKGLDEHMAHNEVLAEKAAQTAISDTLVGKLAALVAIVVGVAIVGILGSSCCAT